jgi:N-hydroxyarylamine O-acetyltransferase
MNVSSYLERVGFKGVARPDLPTLRALHRAHVHTVPFENIDVQLRRPLTLDVGATYDKLVNRRRGGWCYELNGLMGWALAQIGFDVMRISAGVMRAVSGDGALGGHLCLLVRLERTYLVDVGFGSSLIEPLPLETGERMDSPYRVGLAPAAAPALLRPRHLDSCPADAGYWRFSESVHGDPFSFDFREEPADEQLLATKCQWQQSNAASPFVQNLVAKRRVGNDYYTLRGRVFTRTDESGEEKSVLDSAAECVRRLRDTFDLDVPEVESLWPAICERHAVLFGAGSR